MKLLIQQIRSFGSLRKEYGVHVSSKMRKPEVSLRTPTYNIGGSDCSFTRQGGVISAMGYVVNIAHYLLLLFRQVFMFEAKILKGNINNIKGFNYKPDNAGFEINLYWTDFPCHIFPTTSVKKQ